MVLVEVSENLDTDLKIILFEPPK